MNKTRSILIMLLALLAFSMVSARIQADSTRLDAETMKAALRTTTIEEGGFIDYVLGLVSKGKLPGELVDSTFEWARKKPTKHRFQYFKQGLIVRAANIGIKI
jgi:hypothetical protein